ncbi:MAG: class I SAM-dependent methyltransferase [Candidatus Thorarchaeota archaeon]
MDSQRPDEAVVGECCADFYSNPLVLRLLDGVFHPGGLALTSLLADKMGIDHRSHVLDLACGDGTTAVFLSQRFGCAVTGLDIGTDLIERGKRKAQDMKVADRVSFNTGLAGSLPFEEGEFTHVISECAICTFYDKKAAATEVSRVVHNEGVLGISDVTLSNREDLDDELKGLLGRVACVADALPFSGYVELFEDAGFKLKDSTLHGSLLHDMTVKVRNRVNLSGAALSDDDRHLIERRDDILRVLDLIEKQITSRNLSYDAFVFKRV